VVRAAPFEQLAASPVGAHLEPVRVEQVVGLAEIRRQIVDRSSQPGSEHPAVDRRRTADPVRTTRSTDSSAGAARE
jgi:hypothetical protein